MRKLIVIIARAILSDCYFSATIAGSGMLIRYLYDTCKMLLLPTSNSNSLQDIMLVQTIVLIPVTTSADTSNN